MQDCSAEQSKVIDFGQLRITRQISVPKVRKCEKVRSHSSFTKGDCTFVVARQAITIRLALYRIRRPAPWGIIGRIWWIVDNFILVIKPSLPI